MPAVMGQVAVMAFGRSDVDKAGASRADRAMDQYAGGEEGAFVDLYDELAPRLHRFALRWTGNRSTAEDAVQQTLLQIHCARHRFVRGGAVLPWAYAIARRLLIDLDRHRVREALRDDGVRSSGDPTPAPSQEEALHRRRAAAEARRDLELLPSGWREAFELVKVEGLSVAETAEVLGITRGMVKIRTHRAAVALREAMARRLRGSSERATRPAPRAPRPGDANDGGVPT